MRHFSIPVLAIYQSAFHQMPKLAWLFIFACLICVQTTVAQSDSAQSDPTKMAALLKAGEFSAAIELAEQEPSLLDRDKQLQSIASAQRSAGMARQSLATVSKINSDLIRSQVLCQELPPFGGTGNGGAGLSGFGDSGFGDSGFGDARSGRNQGAGGGAAIADFDPLIELIQNTIDPQSWLDTNGGPGTINEFRSGVTVDARGELKKVEFKNNNDLLKDLRKTASKRSVNANVFKDSGLRKVSLNRLEKQCQLLAAQGKDPSEVMQRLAGLYEIKYLLVYPETGDVVLAGPAGDWRTDVEGVAVNVRTGKPLFRLDDLVVCLRNAVEHGGKFGCSIDPRQANLKATQEFIATSPLKGKRWRDGLRQALGLQDISVDGIDPESVVARVIIEADYRMKLVGMDLEKGVPGVESFLSRVELDKNGNVPPQDVMRLEFVLNYDNISVTEARDAYQLHGKGVKVVSEKELLNSKGERIHTGKSEGPADDFARGFTNHFDDMADRYPIYRQLKNVFDLAMVANLIRAEDIDKKCKWNLSYFAPQQTAEYQYATRKGNIPREVKTVMNYREIDVRRNGRKVKTHLVVGVSGGVTVDAGSLLKDKQILKTDTYGKMKLDRKSGIPADMDNWWWD